MQTSIILQIDFTDEWYKRDRSPESWDKIIPMLLEISDVQEVCVDHLCWLKIEAISINAIKPLIEKTKAEIWRVLNEL